MPLLTLIQQKTKDSMAKHPFYPPSLPPKKLELQSAPPRPGQVINIILLKRSTLKLLEFFYLFKKKILFQILTFKGSEKPFSNQFYINCTEKTVTTTNYA